ncbi:hypothetical protein [Candidatus Hodarchaeum mangrovi]
MSYYQLRSKFIVSTLLFVIWLACMLPLIILLVLIKYEVENQSAYYLFFFYLILGIIFGCFGIYYYWQVKNYPQQ